MMVGKNGACQIIKVKTVPFALVALAMRLSIILTSFNDLRTLATRAAYTITPSSLANDLVTFGIINQGGQVDVHLRLYLASLLVS